MVTGILAAVGEGERAMAFDLFLILAVAGAVAIVMQRMRLAIVPAYLIAGALIGPNVPWSILTDQESLEQVSHLAIVLLLFGIGLELDISMLRRGLSRMIFAGVGSCVLTVALGYPVARLFHLSPPAALAICMAFSLSSTAVVLKIIAARRELRRRSGRLSFAILVVQDILVLAMLAVLPSLARWAGAGAADAVEAQPMNWLDFAADACLMIGGVGALVVVAKAILPWLLRESMRGRRLEVMMLVGLSAALAAALVAQFIGFSLEMGAFLAGFVLSGTPFRHQLSGQIGPLRDIFSALFFTTVGMKLDPAALADGWWVVLLGVTILVVLKSTVISGVCWAAGALASNAIIVGLSLAQAGEFSLILIGAAEKVGIFAPEVGPTAIAVVVISLILTPALADLGRRLGRAAAGAGHAPWIRSALFGDAPDLEKPAGHDLRHVILGGFGPVGRRIAEELDHAGISYTIIELNPDTVVEQLRKHRSIVFGDVANIKVLESAGIGHADALVLTIPDDDAVLRACVAARRRSTNVFIAARTGLDNKRKTLADIGADHVTVDEMTAAEDMVRVIMHRFVLEPSEVEPEPETDPDPEPEPEPDPVGSQEQVKRDEPNTDGESPPSGAERSAR